MAVDYTGIADTIRGQVNRMPEEDRTGMALAIILRALPEISLNPLAKAYREALLDYVPDDIKQWFSEADRLAARAFRAFSESDPKTDDYERRLKEIADMPDAERHRFMFGEPEKLARMSACNKCGERYPSAPPGFIHKCGRCSGGMCVPEKNHD